jgi:gas vesicle protein
MMNKSKFLAVMLMGGILGTGIVACEKKGPAERAGEKIDDAAKDVKDGAEKAGDKIENAADNVKEKLDGDGK